MNRTLVGLAAAVRGSTVEDPSETKNLAEKRPDKLAEVQKLYAEWDKKNIAPLWRRSEGGD